MPYFRSFIVAYCFFLLWVLTPPLPSFIVAYGFFFLWALIPFLFFQIPQGKKSFIWFTVLLLVIFCLFYYDYYDCVHNNRFYRRGTQLYRCKDEIGIGWALFRMIMMSCLVSLSVRGVALYFYKESRVKRITVASFAFVLTYAAFIFLKW